MLLFEVVFTACHSGDYTHYQIHYAVAHDMYAVSPLHLFSDALDDAASSQRKELHYRCSHVQ